MRFRDKIGPLHHPILKPANLPDFLTVARMLLKRVLRQGVQPPDLLAHRTDRCHRVGFHRQQIGSSCSYLPQFDIVKRVL
jgi:hypothetical protein